jgi:hypothetical protein
MVNTVERTNTRRKWTSAEEKRRHQELEKNWQEIQQRWQTPVKPVPNHVKKDIYKAPAPYRRGNTNHIPSVQQVHTGAIAKPVQNQYTGSAMLGVAVLHKSNSVPVFSRDEAIEISKMRRG